MVPHAVICQMFLTFQGKHLGFKVRIGIKNYIYQGQLTEFGFCMGPCDESLIGSYLVFLKICESGVENKHWTIAVPHTCNEEVGEVG